MTEITQPLKAIRTFCIKECASTNVSKCEDANCPLHAFRMGKNPYRKKRELTPEQRQALVERMEKARAAIGGAKKAAAKKPAAKKKAAAKKAVRKAK